MLIGQLVYRVARVDNCFIKLCLPWPSSREQSQACSKENYIRGEWKAHSSSSGKMHFLRVSDRFGDIWNNTLKDDAVKAVVADRGKGTYSSRLSFFFFFTALRRLSTAQWNSTFAYATPSCFALKTIVLRYRYTRGFTDLRSHWRSNKT